MFIYHFCLFICLELTFTQSINENTNGLPGILSVNTRNITTVAEGVKIADDELSTNVKERQTLRNTYPNVIPRKGIDTQVIVPRKGVDLSNFSTTMKTIDINTTESNREMSKLILNEKNNSTTLNNSTVKISNNERKKFKPKPTATIGGLDNDSKKVSHLSVPTKTPPLGMPTKMTYVVPVIATILILPFFILSTIYIYKHSRDCWNKRHYRRMDFLIDGMYNE